MKKFIITIFILFCGLKIFAFSNPEVTKECELMSLNQDNLSPLDKGGCRYAFQLNGKSRYAYLEKCPKLFKDKYIYIRSNVELLKLDDMEISSKRHCDPGLYKNLISYGQLRVPNETIALFYDNIKLNDPMSSLNKIHFYRIRTNGKIWTYHYSPGVSVDVEVTGERCAWFKLCMDENKQKFSKLLDTYVDFVWMDDKDEVYYSSALEKK